MHCGEVQQRADKCFPTDANDASEEELEAESWTRGERGPYPRILISTWMKKNSVGLHLMKLYICRGTWSPVGFYSVFDQYCARYYSTVKYQTGYIGNYASDQNNLKYSDVGIPWG